MEANGYRLGGEQSGHIIFRKYAATGDGILTAIKMMEVMLEKKMTLSKLAEPFTVYPQVLKNIRVRDKAAARNDEANNINHTNKKHRRFLPPDHFLLGETKEELKWYTTAPELQKESDKGGRNWE